MSNARKLADLLDSAGDIKSAHLDNVPASDNASSLTTGTIPIARIADDAITNAKMADDAIDSAQIASGAVDNAHLATGISSSKLTGALPAIDGSSLTGVQPFPSGTVMVFYQASAPTGWTKSTSQNNKALRVVSGTGGGSGGSWDLSSGDTSSSTGAHTHTGPSHTHSTPSHSHSHSLSAGSHTLSTSQMPSHKHRVKVNNGGYSCGNCCPEHFSLQNKGQTGGQGSCYNNTVQFYSAPSVENTGSTSSHSHSLSGSISSGGSGTSGSGGTGNTSSNGSHTHTISAPKYIDVIVCSKD